MGHIRSSELPVISVIKELLNIYHMSGSVLGEDTAISKTEFWPSLQLFIVRVWVGGMESSKQSMTTQQFM